MQPINEPLFMTNEDWYEFDFGLGKLVLTDEGKSIPIVVDSYDQFYELLDSQIIEVE